MLRALWVLFGLSLALRVNPMVGQATKTSLTTPSCSTCRIHTEVELRLGATDGPDAFPDISIDVGIDSRGRYFVAPQWMGEPIYVFDQDGKFLKHLGRGGSGPGEFSDIIQFDIRNDSLFIYDAGNTRLTQMGPDLDIRKASTRRLPASPFMIAYLPRRDEYILNGKVGSNPNRFGIPFHRFDLTTNPPKFVGESFGRAPDDLYYSSSQVLRRIAPATDGETFWSIHRFTYYIERFDSEGNLLDVYVRDVDWFDHNRASQQPNQERPNKPDAFVNSLYEDQRHRLWVLIAVPSPEWQDGVEWKETSFRERNRAYEIRWNVAYNTRIDVIDTEKDELLVSHEVPGLVYEMISDSQAAAWTMNDLMVPFVEIRRVELRGM